MSDIREISDIELAGVSMYNNHKRPKQAMAGSTESTKNPVDESTQGENSNTR